MRFRALCVGVGQLLPLPPLHSLDRVCLPLRVAGRTGSALLPPLDLMVVSASGVVRGGSFFRTFGFPEVGALSFPDPFRRLSVPPLAGLEGQGCGALGCRGAEGWLLSALPQRPSSFQCSHPNAFFQPHLHHGGCSGGGHLRHNCQGCCGACSTPFSRLLQPSVRCVEDLGVMASGHRPLPSQSLCGRVSLPDGDHSVCAPVGASGGLVGLHRSEGCVSSSAGSSSFSSLSSLRFQRHCLPIQSAVLWPLHGSAGLHQGHGSCFSYTPFYGDPYGTVSRRLASPVCLSGVPPPGSSDCPPTLSRVGDCGRPPEMLAGSIAGGSVSGGCHRLHLFQGFSVGGAHLMAAVNSRRVSVLRLASRELMALATRRTFFAGSPSSWRQTEDAVPPALPPSILGSSGSGESSVCVDGVSSRPPVVAPSPSSISRSVSLPGVSRPTLLVRRGVGCPSRSSDRFRPVGRPPGGVIHKRQGTASCQTGSSPVPVISTGSHGGCLLRLHHSGGLSSQGGWHKISSPQLLSSDLALDGVHLHPPGSAVPRGRPVLTSPAPTFRVVIKPDRFSIFEKTLAGPNRFICHLRLSSLFDLLLTIPGSNVSRHGRVSPVLRSGSTLDPAPLVLRPAPAFAGSSSGPAGPSRPLPLASVSSSLPGPPSAQASCLATLQRFTRAAGFSSAVAEQSSLARRPSSCAVYQVRWSIYRAWCHNNGHSVSRPTLAKVAVFLC